MTNNNCYSLLRLGTSFLCIWVAVDSSQYSLTSSFSSTSICPCCQWSSKVTFEFPFIFPSNFLCLALHPFKSGLSLFFFFPPLALLPTCRILVPWPVIEARPWQWKHWVLTGPPGNFPALDTPPTTLIWHLSFLDHSHSVFIPGAFLCSDSSPFWELSSHIRSWFCLYQS